MSMRALLLIAALACAACHQAEMQPASEWPAADPALLGAVNLESGCIEDFDPEIDYFPDKTEFRRSAQLEVRYHGFYKEVLFTPAVDNKEVLRYALAQCGAPAPPGFPPARVIQIPIRRFTTGSSSIFSAVTLLEIEDRLVGVPNRFRITEPTIRKLAMEREIPEVSGGTHSNIELAMAVDPDVHLTFYSAYPEFNLHPKLWEVGVTAFPMADHMEMTPLGRSEWVKLLALLTNREAHANDWFDQAERDYEALRTLTADVSHRPPVLYGTPDSRDFWQVRGDRNYFAQLVRDAGGEYFWERGGASSWEHAAYEDALYRSADTLLWVGITGMAGVESVDQLVASDGRFAWLRPVQMERVYALDHSEAGAWTSRWTDQSLDKPERALADLVRVIHPEIAVEHEEYFIRPLD